MFFFWSANRVDTPAVLVKGFLSGTSPRQTSRGGPCLFGQFCVVFGPGLSVGLPSITQTARSKPFVSAVGRRCLWQSCERGRWEVPVQLPVPADQLPPARPPGAPQTLVRARFPQKPEGEKSVFVSSPRLERLGLGKGHTLMPAAVILYML